VKETSPKGLYTVKFHSHNDQKEKKGYKQNAVSYTIMGMTSQISRGKMAALLWFE
jgi:hypothetical protein